MEHFDIGSAIELAKHYAPIAKPVMSLVGTVLSVRQNALTAAQLHEHSADIARLTEESNRTQDMIQSLAVALENYERDGILTEDLVHQQTADPELSQFVERAADASAASKLESKRHVFGRFVAKRLLAVEEDDIVLLRRGNEHHIRFGRDSTSRNRRDRHDSEPDEAVVAVSESRERGGVREGAFRCCSRPVQEQAVDAVRSGHVGFGRGIGRRSARRRCHVGRERRIESRPMVP